MFNKNSNKLSELDICLGVSISISELPAELTIMQCGGVYFVGTSLISELHVLLRQMFAAVESNGRIALISEKNESFSLEKIISEVESSGDVRLYNIKNIKKALPKLNRVLHKRLRPLNRLIVVVLDVSYLSADSTKLLSLLRRWRKWLHDSGCTLLFLCYGTNADRLPYSLMRFNDLISGLAVIKINTKGDTYNYKVFHWRSPIKVNGTRAFTLANTPNGFKVVKSQKTVNKDTVWYGDEDKLFIEKSALEGAPDFIVANWVVCDSWQAIYKHGLVADASTLVFTLSDQSDLPMLVRMIHTLRRQRGLHIKIVVRVMQRPMRSYDEIMLLDCGATLVIPAGTHLSSFFGLLETVQGQVYARNLVDDVEFLIEQRSRLMRSGTLSVPDFIKHVRLLFDQIVLFSASGALVKLVPVKGLSAGQAFSQIRLRRAGDVACCTDDYVYLFLLGCRPAFVDQALNNIFNLPLDNLFVSHIAFYDVPAIKQEITELSYVNKGELTDVVSMEEFKQPGLIAGNEFTAQSQINPTLKSLLIFSSHVSN